MSSIFIKDVLLDGRKTNILIEDNRFVDLAADFDAFKSQGAQKSAARDFRLINGGGLAILPPFYNTHTHAAMSLLRGYADDMPLKTWLEDHIWPREDKLTPEDIYEGTRMAIREMIRTGSVFMNNMYFDIDEEIRAIEETGIRACVGVTFMDNHSKAQRDSKVDFIRSWKGTPSGRVQIAAAPHAIYTVSEDVLRSVRTIATENNIPIHIHLSETESEVADCIKLHGKTPVKYLDDMGFLGPDVICAHLVHLTDEDIRIIVDRGVVAAHCPCSNMKLSSGIAPMQKLSEAGCRITLGTDGSASNNNLDMREEMKFAALLAKSVGEPTDAPATEVLKWATVNGAQTFGIDAGEIKVGKLADAILVDTENYKMQPCTNLISNWVYSADSSCIDTVICDGRVLMCGGELEV